MFSAGPETAGSPTGGGCNPRGGNRGSMDTVTRVSPTYALLEQLLLIRPSQRLYCSFGVVGMWFGGLHPASCDPEGRSVEIKLNGARRAAPENVSLADLLAEIEAPPGRVATLVNASLVPAEQRQQFILHEGDRVEVLTFAAGG